MEADGRGMARWLEAGVAGLLLLAVLTIPIGAVRYERERRAADQAVTLTGRVVHSQGGGWTPSEVRVRTGAPVTLRLTSADVTHGLLIPDLGVNSGPITPGEFKVIQFVAPQPGVYRIYCNVLCSPHHGAMVARLVVEP